MQSGENGPSAATDVAIAKFAAINRILQRRYSDPGESISHKPNIIFDRQSRDQQAFFRDYK